MQRPPLPARTPGPRRSHRRRHPLAPLGHALTAWHPSGRLWECPPPAATERPAALRSAVPLQDAGDPAQRGLGVEAVVQRGQPPADDALVAEPVAAGVDSDELVGVAEEHRAAGVAAAGGAVRFAWHVLQEEEQVGQPVPDTALTAWGVVLHRLPPLQREGAARRAAADLVAGLPVADVGELQVGLPA